MTRENVEAWQRHCNAATKLLNSSHVVFLQNGWGPSKKIFKEINVVSAWVSKVTFIGCDRGGVEEQLNNCSNVLNVRVKFRLFRARAATFLAGVTIIPWLVLSFVKLCFSHPNIVHAVDLPSGIPAMLYTGITKKELIYDILDPYWMRYRFPTLLKLLTRWLELLVIKHADQVIAVDNNRIGGWESRYSEKFSIVYNSPPDSWNGGYVDEEREELVVYTSGWLRDQRGLRFLIDAVTLVPGVRLILAGDIVGAERDEILRIVKRSPQVTFLGKKGYYEALALYNTADLVVAFYDPDREINRHASGNKLFDAMMSARPIIVNEEMDWASFVISEGFGYSVRYGDAKQLGQLLSLIKGERQELRRKGLQARRLYESSFSWDKQSDVLKSVYLHVAGLRAANT